MSNALNTEPVDEIPPVRREETSSKYDPVLEDARAQGLVKVTLEDRGKAASVTSYLKRITNEEEFEVTQRLNEVYVRAL